MKLTYLQIRFIRAVLLCETAVRTKEEVLQIIDLFEVPGSNALPTLYSTLYDSVQSCTDAPLKIIQNANMRLFIRRLIEVADTHNLMSQLMNGKNHVIYQ